MNYEVGFWLILLLPNIPRFWKEENKFWRATNIAATAICISKIVDNWR